MLSSIKAHLSIDKTDNSRVKELLNLTFDEVRNISSDLSSNTLELIGLSEALVDLKTQLQQLDISCVLQTKNTELISNNIAIHIFRMAQEFCQNCIKHSKAKNALIQVLGVDEGVIITFEDDGIGYDTSNKKLSGNGLKNIEYRANVCKGTVNFYSEPNEGTSIVINIPWDKKA